MAKAHIPFRFNPHPPLLAGETIRAVAVGAPVKVSIHTRHYWRVKRLVQVLIHPHKRFNPHPPLLAGKTKLQYTGRQRDFVSIHTRHYWRVKR